MPGVGALIGLLGGGLDGDSVGDLAGIALLSAAVPGAALVSPLCLLLALCSKGIACLAGDGVGEPSVNLGGGERAGRRAACAKGDWRAVCAVVLPCSARVAGRL